MTYHTKTESRAVQVERSGFESIERVLLEADMGRHSMTDQHFACVLFPRGNKNFRQGNIERGGEMISPPLETHGAIPLNTGLPSSNSMIKLPSIIFVVYTVSSSAALNLG